jgi:hypothetical protein
VAWPEKALTWAWWAAMYHGVIGVRTERNVGHDGV